MTRRYAPRRTCRRTRARESRRCAPRASGLRNLRAPERSVPDPFDPPPSRALRHAVLGLLILATPAAGWDFGGRVGAEFEGLGERFEAASLFDERVLPDGSIEDVLETDPVLSRSLSALGLLELRLDSDALAPLSCSVSDVARVGDSRRRNSLRVESGYRAGADRLRLEGQWDAQGGKDEPAAGSNARLAGTWDRNRLPLGLRSQLRLGADWSHTEEEDLAPILESRVLRGHAELRRTMGRDLELRGQVGYRHKDALGSRIGSYDAWIAETESDGTLGWSDRVLLLLRAEDRNHAADTLGIPSSRLAEVTARYEVARRDWIRPYTEHRFEWQTYDAASDIFRDHHGWSGEVGTELLWDASRGLRGSRRDDDSPDLRLRLGGQVEVFRSKATATDTLAIDSTFDSYGGVLGIAREGSEEFWFDVSVEAGRRDYRNEAGSGSLVFEGLNLSLASTDYTYVHTSLLLDWAPAPWVRTEAFLQWDEELHEVSTDDFRLWMVSLSITHPF